MSTFTLPRPLTVAELRAFLEHHPDHHEVTIRLNPAVSVAVVGIEQGMTEVLLLPRDDLQPAGSCVCGGGY